MWSACMLIPPTMNLPPDLRKSAADVTAGRRKSRPAWTRWGSAPARRSWRIRGATRLTAQSARHCWKISRTSEGRLSKSSPAATLPNSMPSGDAMPGALVCLRRQGPISMGCRKHAVSWEGCRISRAVAFRYGRDGSGTASRCRLHNPRSEVDVRSAMAQFFVIHPDNPQPRLIRQAAEIVRGGGLIAYPTDSCYALGCHLGDKAAVMRMRAIRQVDARHHFALVCRDLAEIAAYARVNNRQFRLLKATTPGSYTFILKATREVPKRLQHPSRKTIGLRIPAHAVVRALLGELGAPLLSSTLLLPGDDTPLNAAQEIRDRP